MSRPTPNNTNRLSSYRPQSAIVSSRNPRNRPALSSPSKKNSMSLFPSALHNQQQLRRPARGRARTLSHLARAHADFSARGQRSCSRRRQADATGNFGKAGGRAVCRCKTAWWQFASAKFTRRSRGKPLVRGTCARRV